MVAEKFKVFGRKKTAHKVFRYFTYIITSTRTSPKTKLASLKRFDIYVFSGANFVSSMSHLKGYVYYCGSNIKYLCCRFANLQNENPFITFCLWWIRRQQKHRLIDLIGSFQMVLISSRNTSYLTGYDCILISLVWHFRSIKRRSLLYFSRRTILCISRKFLLEFLYLRKM